MKKLMLMYDPETGQVQIESEQCDVALALGMMATAKIIMELRLQDAIRTRLINVNENYRLPLDFVTNKH